MSANGSERRFEIEDGVCSVVYAYDVGLSIDLRRLEGVLGDGGWELGGLARTRRAPRLPEFDLPPLRVREESDAIEIGAWRTEASVELTVYEFGAVSVQHAIPIRGPLDGLVELSEALYANAALETASRRAVERLVERIRDVVTRPDIARFEEDYVLFRIHALGGSVRPGEILERDPALLARVLRAESGELSPQEVEDAVSHRISYGPDDLVLVDWMTAVAFDRNTNDVRAILEHANAELLEMQLLDRELDRHLESSHEIPLPGALRDWRHRFFIRSDARRIRQMAQLHIEAAWLFEGVDNALKLMGDDYLARVYRLATERLHLSDWGTSVRRKLAVLEGTYEKVTDFQTTRRLELLEWIIIVLITISILLMIFPGGGH